MAPDLTIMFWYLIVLLLQTIHIFEEIGMGAYRLAGSLQKYVMVAAVLVSVNYAGAILLVSGFSAGYYPGLLAAVMAILNGLIHLVGFLNSGTYKDSIGAGVFSGVLLAASGIVLLYQLLPVIL